MLTDALAAVTDGLGDARPAVFVPAIMGAGLMFSVATIVRDLLSRGSRTMQVRRARIQGRLVATSVGYPTGGRLLPATRPVGRAGFVAVAVLATAFAGYLLVGSTANFLRDDGHVSRVAWLFGASLVLIAAAMVLAVACVAVAVHPEGPPSWTWPILLLTPLLGIDDTPQGERARWVVVGGLTSTVLLAGLATWPHVLRPIDDALAGLVDEPAWTRLEPVADVLGSTELTLVVAVLVGVATLRCRRFAWVFVVSVIASLTATTVVRWLVDRPRPTDGPLVGGTDSFPSGHLVQITLLATLVPLAIDELTRSHRARRWTSVILGLAVAIVAIGRIANRHHAPTDVLAGVAVGLAIGFWARLALAVPEGHRDCGSCLANSERRPRGPRRPTPPPDDVIDDRRPVGTGER